MESKGNYDKTKEKQAEKEFKAGKAALKTGMLKWNPDHIGAQLHFESAAKIYKQIGLDDKAIEAYCLYAKSSEATDTISCAADGYTQAAFLCKDQAKSEGLLKQAQQLYLIDGKGERGLQSLMKFATQMREQYEDADEQDPNQLKKILILYKSLFSQVFQGENYLFCEPVINEYITLLAGNEKYDEAQNAKTEFINYLVKEGEIDHQIRRAYLELLCLNILSDDKFKIKSTMTEFMGKVPNCHSTDEFRIAERIQQAVLGDGQDAFNEIDWYEVKDLVHDKPIFGFLNNEIIKKLKMLLIVKIEEWERNEELKEQKKMEKPKEEDPEEEEPQTEEQVDNMFL